MWMWSSKSSFKLIKLGNSGTTLLDLHCNSYTKTNYDQKYERHFIKMEPNIVNTFYPNLFNVEKLHITDHFQRKVHIMYSGSDQLGQACKLSTKTRAIIKFIIYPRCI